MTKEEYLELLDRQFKTVVDNKLLPTDPNIRMAWLRMKKDWLSANGKLWESSGETQLGRFVGWMNNLMSAAAGFAVTELLEAESSFEFHSLLRESAWEQAGVDLTEEERDAMHLFGETFGRRVNELLEAKRQALMAAES